MFFFASTVFLSAFLLFQIQPIVGKMILPWFGGSSSVWSVCIVFFQAALLLGYAYVHWLHEKLAPRQQLRLHMALLLASLLALPVAADPSWKGAALEHPGWNVLAVLATAVGIPYLLLSTTGPLMQAWYARTYSAAVTSAHPYRLYALSNLASMLALLSYPVLIEPIWAVDTQARGWSIGYALFVASCLATSLYAWRRVSASDRSAETASLDPAPAPSWAECLLWIGLSATPSILLLSLTRHLTQDVAPIPFLWVLPLSIYLLSFILCFDAPRYYVRPLFMTLTVLSFVALDFSLDDGTDVQWLVPLISISLFAFCMVCHGELVRRKPPPRHLTLFYLMLSIGGAVGGVVVGLVAPAVFNAYYELPLGLFLCAALVLIVVWPELRSMWKFLLLLMLLGYGLRLGMISFGYVDGFRLVVRNFYSQLRVVDNPDSKHGHLRQLVHGRINHGEQYLSPNLRRSPTAYYCEKSGIGRAFHAQDGVSPRKVGILGLGTGTLAAYGRAGDELRFYEINEQVLDLARNEFSYLSDSPAQVQHILGDGRLMLEREQAQQFDLLVMDAFAGDSIPTHLLTLEAMKTYFGHLKSGGILAVHITNHYLDLKPVMAAIAQQFGKTALMQDFAPGDDSPLCMNSNWVLLVDPASTARLLPQLENAQTLQVRAGFRPWTDSFTNLLGILK